MQCHHHCMLIKDGNGTSRTGTNTSLMWSWVIYGSPLSVVTCTCRFYSDEASVDMPWVTYSSSLHYWQPLHMAGCQCGQSSGDIFTLTWIESLWEMWVDCTCFLWSLYPHCSFTLLCLVFHNLWQVVALWMVCGHLALQVYSMTTSGWEHVIKGVNLKIGDSRSGSEIQLNQFESVLRLRDARVMNPENNGEVLSH